MLSYLVSSRCWRCCSPSWLHCGAVWSAIFGAGTREAVMEPLDYVLPGSASRWVWPAVQVWSWPLGKVRAVWCHPCGRWAWLSNTWAWCGVFWASVSNSMCCLASCRSWNRRYLSGGDKYWTCELFIQECLYIDPYLWVTCVLRLGPCASRGHMGLFMSSVLSYWLLYTCACFLYRY